MMMQLYEKSVTGSTVSPTVLHCLQNHQRERERERVREREGERERERVRVDDESTTPCHHLCVLF